MMNHSSFRIAAFVAGVADYHWRYPRSAIAGLRSGRSRSRRGYVIQTG
jgi:hypothetical protein